MPGPHKISAAVAPNSETVAAKDCSPENAPDEAFKDWKALKEATENLDDSLTKSVMDSLFGGTTLDTKIKTDISFETKALDQARFAAILRDYKGEQEANFTLSLDNETISIPITHDNVTKIVHAYSEATATAKSLATKLKTGGKSISEDEIYSGVTKALKDSLKSLNLIK